MGELGRLIEAYKDREAAHDRFGRRPTNADIARKVGVTRSTVGHWIAGKMPVAESIPALAVTIGETPARVLVAALADSGYLLRERDLDGRDAAAMTRAGGSPAGAELDALGEAILAHFRHYAEQADEARKSKRYSKEWLARLRADFEAAVLSEFARVRTGTARKVV